MGNVRVCLVFEACLVKDFLMQRYIYVCLFVFLKKKVEEWGGDAEQAVNKTIQKYVTGNC